MKGVIGGLLLVVLVLGLVLILMDRIDPVKANLREQATEFNRQQQAELQPFILTAKKVLIVAGTALLASLAVIVVALALDVAGSVPHVWRWAWVRSWLIFPRTQGAMYPAQAAPDGSGHFTVRGAPNEFGSQRAAAVATGLQPGARLQGSAVRQLVNKGDECYVFEQDQATRTLRAAEVLDNYDPSKRPHYFFIGESGSGKTSAVYEVVEHLRRNMGAEFLILEYGGNNWNEQAAAITPAGYVAAFQKIAEERERREKLIRAEDCQEADRLQNPPPFLVVVIEEAENVYAAVKTLGQSYRNLYRDTVRDLAAMGRKQRILLVVATTSGTSDVFDMPVRKNLGNKFVFRSEPTTGDTYSIPREVMLPRLPTGIAYSVGDGALVQFPHIARPKLPASSLYREARPEERETVLRLAMDATLSTADAAQGILSPTEAGEKDTPSTSRTATVVDREMVCAATTRGITGTSTPTVPLQQRIDRIPKDRVPRDPADQEALYLLWCQVGRNASEVERQVYKYDGGVAHYYAAYGINRALVRRKLPPAYKEKEIGA